MSQPTFADLTTLRVGGPIGSLVDATSEAEILSTVQQADADGAPLLVVGGGSNLLVSDEGFAGIVLRDARRDIVIEDEGMCGGGTITAPAGAVWDDLVAQCVRDGWVGFEALSGIPGSVGAVPVQNVGAYGQEVSNLVSVVRAWDRTEGRLRTFARVNCEFGYRDSLFKRESPRFVVLDVTFHVRAGSRSLPVQYKQLADAMGIEVGERAEMADVRAAVLELRASKGMVLDAADHDTWSAGSFFTNPILSVADAAKLPADAPRYPVVASTVSNATGTTVTSDAAPDQVKTSAAWLIEHAGFGRGFAVAEGAAASLSTKHTLALTNRGAATAADVAALARTVRQGVQDAFGVTLVPEPVFVGVEL